MGKRSEMKNVTSLSRKFSLDIYSPYTYSITGPHPSIHPSYKILWDIAERRCLFHDTSSMNGSDQLNQHTPCLLIPVYPPSHQDLACRRVCFSPGYLDDRKSVVARQLGIIDVGILGILTVRRTPQQAANNVNAQVTKKTCVTKGVCPYQSMSTHHQILCYSYQRFVCE